MSALFHPHLCGRIATEWLISMKTRYWLLILAATVLLCSIGATLLLSRQPATHAQIYSGGKLLCTLDLSIDQELTVPQGTGFNTVIVNDGKIAVTAASCPDGICMRRGWCDQGLAIVCLPNKMEIRFTSPGQVDAAVG